MSNFALIENGVVKNLVVADNIEWLQNNLDGNWIEMADDQSRESRLGIGWSYNDEYGVFFPPKPYNSWVINPDTLDWTAPIIRPEDGQSYEWNEDTVSWELIITES